MSIFGLREGGGADGCIKDCCPQKNRRMDVGGREGSGPLSCGRELHQTSRKNKSIKGQCGGSWVGKFQKKKKREVNFTFVSKPNLGKRENELDKVCPPAGTRRRPDLYPR